jgi:hypothetical protein
MIVMDFNQSKNAINQELDQFLFALNQLLPRYSYLVNKDFIDPIELKELGEIEHFLIEVNSKIRDIKNRLDQNLFGHSLDLYYKYKEAAKKGDVLAQNKMERLHNFFNETLKGNEAINWN